MAGQLRRGSVRLLVACVCVAAPLAFAEDSAYRDEVRKILDVGWGKGFLVLQPAREHYENATRLKATDPLAPYALALAHVKQSRYAEARKLADEAVSLNTKLLPARQLGIFLAVRAKEHDEALARIDELAKVLDAAEAAPEVVERARFLGKLLGYMAGPGGVDAGQVQAARERLAQRLSEDARRALDEGMREVAARFAELRLGRDQAKEDAEAAQAEAKRREAERLEREKEQIAEGKEELEAQAANARQEAESLISEIDRNVAPLQRKLSELAAQAAPIRRRMTDLAAEIGRLRALSANTEDPNERFRLQLEIDRLNRLYDRLEAEYAVLDREAGLVRGNLAALEQRRNAAIASYEAVMKKLGKQADNLRKTAAKIGRLEEKNAQPPNGNTPGVRASTTIVQALTTYVNFPLESEKHRLLELLK